ncbi:MAG TPA: PAS domain-containing sensor histidine kinase [Candidatus Binatia bacterium]|nr:PAS domain-containing sensor histidine kinase [Candidatus Binatia bacterium]
MQYQRTPVEQFLRLLAEQSKEHAFILLDADGRVTWWSPGATHLFDRDAEEMVGQPLTRLFTPEDVEKGIPEQELAIARDVGKAEDDRWQLRADGSRLWVTGMSVALRDENGNLLGFGKIVRNRTDLKEQLETLRNEVKTLTSRDEQKNIFVATLSHELRNPLTPLSSAVQLLRKTAPATAALEYPIKLIERQVEFIQRLVDDLLDVTRITTGKIRLNKQKVALHEIVNRAVEAIQPLIEERDQNLQVLLPSNPIEFVADPDRLHQVLVNLITNAAKFTPHEETIWVKGTIEGEEVVVHVEDTGVGIPPAMLAGIFDLFTQVETPLSHGGLGIGLSLVRNLVTLHGGSVQVRSDGLGKGSEFTVRLPLNLSQSEA